MAQTIYENFVIGNKYDSVLSTKLNFQNFLTIDDSLTETAGMIKKINTRTVTGSVENLAMGVGNSGNIEVTTSTQPYTVGTTQGRFAYYDEEALADDKVVDSGLTGISEVMVNDFTAKALEEWVKTSNKITLGADGITFNDVVDALAKLNFEDESQVFMLIGTDTLAALRKNLKDDLKYVESFVKTGYVGSVCGVPVYVSKALSDNGGMAILATKEACTLFLKKDTEIEQERDANTRKNIIYARKVSVVALTDASKCVVLAGA